MNLPNIFMLLIVGGAFLYTACNKEEKPPVSLTDMWACHHEMTWDSVQSRNALLGEWACAFTGFYFFDDGKNYNVNKGLMVVFNPDGTLEVTEKGQITKICNWILAPGDGDLFCVKVVPYVPQLIGRILFCNERVVFNDSYKDGSDNYFIKK